MYAENSIYEIHVNSKGQWKTIGTFDEAGAAIAEAVRLRRGRKYVGIRVTEETFRQAAGNFASRVVYRYSLETRYRRPMVTSPAIAIPTRQTGTPERYGVDDAMTEAETLPPPEIQDLIQMLAIRLGFVILAAILALMAIRSV